MKSTLRIRITVRGRLSRNLAAAFDGLTLIRRGGGTDLVGEIADQTQLHGVLTRIRDLGLELVSVTVSDADSTTPDRQRSVVRRDASARKFGCAAPHAVGSTKRNKLEGGLP
jgi:hypothetical protein